MREEFNSEKFVEHRTLDGNNLASEMRDISSYLGYYGEQVALWQSVLDNLKVQLEVRAAEVTLELKATGEKVDQVKAAVTVDPAYNRLKKAELKAKEQVNLYKIAVDAMDKKGNMASSIGAMKRSEMSSLHTNVTVGAMGSTGPSGPPGTYSYHSGGPVSGSASASEYTVPISHPVSGRLSDERKAEVLALLAKTK